MLQDKYLDKINSKIIKDHFKSPDKNELPVIKWVWFYKKWPIEKRDMTSASIYKKFSRILVSNLHSTAEKNTEKTEITQRRALRRNGRV